MNSSTGHDVVGAQSIKMQNSPGVPFSSYSCTREVIFKLLKESDKPLNVTQIAKALHLTWGTAKSNLLELLLNGRVRCYRVGSNLVFQIKITSKEVEK